MFVCLPSIFARVCADRNLRLDDPRDKMCVCQLPTTERSRWTLVGGVSLQHAHTQPCLLPRPSGAGPTVKNSLPPPPCRSGWSCTSAATSYLSPSSKENNRMRASFQRCMRFTVGALACNAACLGFATGLAKAPSQSVSSRMSLKTSPVTKGQGPLRGVEPAEEPGLRQRLGAKAWTTGRRIWSLRGQQDRGAAGEEGFKGEGLADSVQVGGRVWRLVGFVCGGSGSDVCIVCVGRCLRHTVHNRCEMPRGGNTCPCWEVSGLESKPARRTTHAHAPLSAFTGRPGPPGPPPFMACSEGYAPV